MKVERLEEEGVGEQFRRELRLRWGEVKESAVEGVEEEWRRLRESLIESAKNVCGIRRVGGRCKRKGSEWWCEEVSIVVRDKKIAFEKFLGTNRIEEWEAYKDKRGLLKEK